MKATRTFNLSIDQNGIQFKEPHIKLVVCYGSIPTKRKQRQRFALLKTICNAERKLNDSCFVLEEFHTVALDKHVNVRTTPASVLNLILIKRNRRKSIVGYCFCACFTHWFWYFCRNCLPCWKFAMLFFGRTVSPLTSTTNTPPDFRP